MIRKLKFKFILLSILSVFSLLTVLIVSMNIVNYNATVREADEILALLSQNKGAFPDFGGNKGDRLPPHLSPELPYESRYFSVLLNDSGQVIHVETSRITAVNSTMAIDYAHTALNQNTDRGFTDKFRFVRSHENNAIRITFLDCGRMLDSFFQFLYTSCLIGLLGFAVVFCIIFFFAGKIIRPIAESYEKQKRFITDAGHEIKTPLTIISANADILEMDLGPNESLSDIQHQTRRLTALTNDLVLLARMEESEQALQMIDFPLSEVVADTALSFRAPAQMQGKEFICQIQPMLSLCGNGKAVGQLVSILMDNALKYTPTNGQITLTLTQQGKNVVLTVWNTTAHPIPRDRLSHVFDRFYRIDRSRNSATGGHGIGLSIAKAIVAAHNGKIYADAPNEQSFRITVLFPR